jgi:trigger factor
MRKLIDAHQFEVPQSLIAQQTKHRLEGVARQMMSRGIDPRSEELNWEGAREELTVQAEDDVRTTMLLEKVAEAENITVSDEEVETEIQSIAIASQQPLEKVRAALTKDGGERSIAHRLRNRKALELLIENASITDGEWIEPKESS